MRGQRGFFDIDERLQELFAKGDDLERLNAIVDFGYSGPIWLARFRGRTGRKADARPLITC
jgi:hypothetical protein